MNGRLSIEKRGGVQCCIKDEETHIKYLLTLQVRYDRDR